MCLDMKNKVMLGEEHAVTNLRNTSKKENSKY